MLVSVDIFIVILMALAAWRLTHMLVREKGPYNLIERFRNAIINYPWSPIHCFKCTSIWVGAVFAIPVSGDIGTYFINLLALSTVAIFIEAIYDRLTIDRV